MTPAEKEAFRARFKPKVEASQERLGDVYDSLDTGLDFLECVYQATFGPNLKDELGHPLRAVLDEAKAKIRTAKDSVSDMVAWVQ